MKKSMKLFIGSIAIIGIAACIVWPYVKMEFASSAYYTQSDEREYEYYTPDLLKRMPRITATYSFQFMNISGPQAFVYGIRFDGTTEAEKVREYLISEGYAPQAKCDIEAQCWHSGRNEDEVTVSKTTSPDTVTVQVYRSNYNN